MPKKKKEWTPHKYLVAAARKTWRWTPQHKLVLQRAQLSKGVWKCEKCLLWVGRIEYITRRGRKARKIDGAIDHIAPVGTGPKTFDEYPNWYRRLYCEPTNLMFLCTACHAAKSAKEAAERAEIRKAAKNNAPKP